MVQKVEYSLLPLLLFITINVTSEWSQQIITWVETVPSKWLYIIKYAKCTPKLMTEWQIQLRFKDLLLSCSETTHGCDRCTSNRFSSTFRFPVVSVRLSCVFKVKMKSWIIFPKDGSSLWYCSCLVRFFLVLLFKLRFPICYHKIFEVISIIY